MALPKGVSGNPGGSRKDRLWFVLPVKIGESFSFDAHNNLSKRFLCAESAAASKQALDDLIGLPSSVAVSSKNIPQALGYDYPSTHLLCHNAERKKMNVILDKLEQAATETSTAWELLE